MKRNELNKDPEILNEFHEEKLDETKKNLIKEDYRELRRDPKDELNYNPINQTQKEQEKIPLRNLHRSLEIPIQRQYMSQFPQIENHNSRYPGYFSQYNQ